MTIEEWIHLNQLTYAQLGRLIGYSGAHLIRVNAGSLKASKRLMCQLSDISSGAINLNKKIKETNAHR
jgi:hypothetical protein